MIPPIQLAHAKTVNPKNTEFIYVSIWNNSNRLIRIDTMIVIKATDTKNE